MLLEFPDHGGFFTEGIPIFVARAPGRLDVMGGIADYSGSLVAELPIGQAALCGAQVDPSGKLTIRSLNIGRTVTVAPGSERDTERWAVYLAGCVAWLVSRTYRVTQLRAEPGLAIGGGIIYAAEPTSRRRSRGGLGGPRRSGPPIK